MVRRSTDAWGEGDVPAQQGKDDPATEFAQLYNSREADAFSIAPSDAKLLPAVLAPAAGATSPQIDSVPTLRAMVLGFLGRHVESLVSQIGPHLAPLPADIKACLLCVARRRGVLSNRVLLALADEGWALMDVAGATALTERALRQALLRCCQLRALDLSGLSSPSPALLRDLPELCPSLELLVVGGCKAQEEAMLEVLPDLLPHMRVREQPQDAVHDSWEDAVSGGGVPPLPDPGVPCGLQRLKLLVWPYAPPLVLHIVRSVNPRVAVAESLPPPHAHRGYGGSGRCSTNSIANGSNGYKSSTRSGSDRTGFGSGSHLHGGIQVIHVRSPDGSGARTQPASSLAASSAAAGGNWWRRQQSGVGGGGGVFQRRAETMGAVGVGNGLGRYTAPHKRQQQQQQEQQQQRHPLQPAAAAVAGEPDGGGGGGAGLAIGAACSADADRPSSLRRLIQQQQQQALHIHHQQPDAYHRGLRVLQRHPLQSHQQHQGLHQQQHGQQQQLDDCLAALVGAEAWEGDGVAGGHREEEEELHIAEKFRRAYEEQDARLRAKVAREAALAERYELRTSGAARALAHWLDQE